MPGTPVHRAVYDDQQHNGQKLYITPKAAAAAAWSIAGWLAGWRAGCRAKRALCCRGDDICTGGGGGGVRVAAKRWTVLVVVQGGAGGRCCCRLHATFIARTRALEERRPTTGGQTKFGRGRT